MESRQSDYKQEPAALFSYRHPKSMEEAAEIFRHKLNEAE